MHHCSFDLIYGYLPTLEQTKEISLQPYNTFGLDVSCKGIIEIKNKDQLKNELSLLAADNEEFMILGGGSNVLFTGNLNKYVLLNRIKGIEILDERDNDVLIEVGSGEIWHDLVLHCVNNGWGGIENLSLIPGCVGASPIQNIGAYGVELKDVFESLTAISTDGSEFRDFTGNECRFGYRDSVFKREFKGKYIITNVRLRLKKNSEPNTSYGAIKKVLEENGISTPSIKDVSDAVIQIRRSKLPDPAVIGNSGSFFKNPVVKRGFYRQISNLYPEMPFYLVDDDHVKIPAGWLIEKAGLKGVRFGNTGCHEHQALVIVNYGGATGAEIVEHAHRVMDTVEKKFGIRLEPEVNII